MKKKETWRVLRRVKMSDVNCPFCDAEGYAVENRTAGFQKRDGSCIPLWGIRFTGHTGDCPFAESPSYRCNYMSKEEAIEAYIIKGNNCGKD